MDDLKAFIIASIPFGRTLGFEVVSISAEEAVFEVRYRDDLTQGGILHGGVLASLIDSVCACAAMARTYPQNYTTTINLQVAYTMPVSRGRVRAVGKCLREGGRVLFCEAHVWNEDGQLVGHGTSQLLRIPMLASR